MDNDATELAALEKRVDRTITEFARDYPFVVQDRARRKSAEDSNAERIIIEALAGLRQSLSA